MGGAIVPGRRRLRPERQRTAIVTGEVPTTNQGTAQMRKIMLSTAAVAMLFSGAALAAAQSETGVIAKIDTKAHSLTLKSGKVKTFELGTGVDASALKVGEKVMVTYDIVNKKPVASEIVVAPAKKS
jgi:Cu/Ag efflux protein CusF